MTAKEPFEFLESNMFFYRSRQNPNFQKIAARMEAILGNISKSRLEELVLDIGILLKGETNNQRYQAAFARYTKYYKDIGSSELFDYCEFLCKTFNIEVLNQRQY